MKSHKLPFFPLLELYLPPQVFDALHRDRIAETLADPDEIRRSARLATARLFIHQFDTIGGKHVVVVVVTDTGPAHRHWVITAYAAQKLTEGVIEWQRN